MIANNSHMIIKILLSIFSMFNAMNNLGAWSEETFQVNYTKILSAKAQHIYKSLSHDISSITLVNAVVGLFYFCYECH